MKIVTFLFCLLLVQISTAQNIGIGTLSPTQTLDVNGTIKASMIMAGGGNKFDFLKNKGGDSVGFSKGFTGLGLNYIIVIQGIYPSQSNSSYPDLILGEIRLFAGNYAPGGFAFCHGQLLPINQNTALFSILGTTYGGNGVTNFALPDLRAAVPVSVGTSTEGNTWDIGERSN